MDYEGSPRNIALLNALQKLKNKEGLCPYEE